MPPSALSYVYCTSEDVVALLSDDGLVARLDDDASGYADAAEDAYMSKMISWASARCNYFLLSKISQSELATSWIVNQWCTIIAAYMVSCRRGNPAAASLKILYDETLEDLKAIQKGEVVLPDVALRTAAFPAFSNLRVDLFYSLRKLRVERGLSETRTQPDYQQSIDRGAENIREPY